MATPTDNGSIENALADSEEAQGRERVPRIDSGMDTSGGADSSTGVLPNGGGSEVTNGQGVDPVSAVLCGPVGPEIQRQLSPAVRQPRFGPPLKSLVKRRLDTSDARDVTGSTQRFSVWRNPRDGTPTWSAKTRNPTRSTTSRCLCPAATSPSAASPSAARAPHVLCRRRCWAVMATMPTTLSPSSHPCCRATASKGPLQALARSPRLSPMTLQGWLPMRAVPDLRDRGADPTLPRGFE